MKLFTKLLAVAVIAAAAGLGANAFGQASGAFQSIAPLTRDLGSIKTMTAQGAATITSADQSGFNVTRIICVFNQASHTGSPSSTFKIQNKDAASGNYYDLVTSSAITSDATATPLAAGGDITTSANLAAGIPIAAKWRVSATIGGSSTPVVTGTIGCSVQ
jgi:hypothetical protein